MPAPGALDYTALPASIRLWLIDHPSEHRARDVAAGITRPPELSVAQWSQKVANALSRMARDGTVVREYRDLGFKKPVGMYRAAGVALPETVGSTTP